MTKVTDNSLGKEPLRAEGDIELDPLCFKDAIALAVTNQGVLIPCCRMDDPKTMNDPLMQDFLKVSVTVSYTHLTLPTTEAV